MFLSLLTSSPALAIAWLLVIVISLTVHEFSHAWAGKVLGDPTAEHAGRLSLNPLKHLDPFGFLMLLVAGFGWAKPVPFNPYALKNPVQGAVIIAFAGPISNFAMAIVAGGLFHALIVSGVLSSTSLLAVFLILLVFTNCALALFNLIPVPPLDGSRLLEAFFAGMRWHKAAEVFVNVGPRLLLVLVLLSLFSDYNAFSFVGNAGFALCDRLSGTSCMGFLLTIF